MYKTIVLDCQTKTDLEQCESCVLYKQCKLKKEPAPTYTCRSEVAEIAAYVSV